MNLRRNLLLASLAAAAFCTTGAQAQDNVLRVGTDATFPPMEFVENGKRTGFDVELVEAIAKTMGKQVEWVDIDFKGLIPGLISKRFDMAVSAIYITDERKKVVDFTDSYYAGGLVVMVKADNKAMNLTHHFLIAMPGMEDELFARSVIYICEHTPRGVLGLCINKLADLDGKKVSVQVGTKSVSYLTEKFPKVQRVEVEKNQEMFNLVDIGRADAAVTGKPAAFQYVRTRPGLRVLDEQLTTEEYGMALRKDTPELTKAVNGAITKLKADGTYAAIVKKWFSNSAAK